MEVIGRTRPESEDLSARKAPGNGSIKLTVNCNLQNAQQRLRVLSFRKRWILFEPKDALKSPCLPEMIFALPAAVSSCSPRSFNRFA